MSDAKIDQNGLTLRCALAHAIGLTCNITGFNNLPELYRVIFCGYGERIICFALAILYFHIFLPLRVFTFQNFLNPIHHL